MSSLPDRAVAIQHRLPESGHSAFLHKPDIAAAEATPAAASILVRKNGLPVLMRRSMPAWIHQALGVSTGISISGSKVLMPPPMSKLRKGSAGGCNQEMAGSVGLVPVLDPLGRQTADSIRLNKSLCCSDAMRSMRRSTLQN